MLEFIRNNLNLVLYCTAGFLGFILLIIFFNAVIFKPNKCKRMANEVDSKFQFCHALLIGQDAQYIKRLEIISRTNLLYVETHTNFSRQYKEIRDKNDLFASQEVNKMKDILADKKFKDFKLAYKSAVRAVNEYEKVINNFTKELSIVVKPEEDSRQESLKYKNQFRGVKQEFCSKESELALMAPSFEEVFTYIDSLFNKFEDLINSAQYDDANEVLKEISGILEELSFHLKDLPSLCTLIANVVPDKIHTIENIYKEMIEDHFPLQNLFVKQTIDNMNKDLADCTEKIRGFDTEGIENILSSIQIKLDDFVEKFKEEKDAREIFESKNVEIYNREAVIERRFITLKNYIPAISGAFILNEDHQKKLAELQGDVNRVGSLKRTLDTYAHSSSKQPYTLIVTKMNELETMSNLTSAKLDEFDSYVDSLKNDSEKAYDTVYSTYFKVKKAEETIRMMNIETVCAKYTPVIESLYNLLNQINSTLMNQPIDVDHVNALVRELFEKSNTLLDDGDIAQDYDMMLLAESAIMFGNRYRNHFAEIDQVLSQAEIFFNNGDFEKANETAKTALNKIKQYNGK